MSLSMTLGPQCNWKIHGGWRGWKEVEDEATRGEFTGLKIVPTP